MTQSEVPYVLLAWAFSTLVYPGLLFAAILALVGERIIAVLRPLMTPRLYRPRSRPRRFMQPVSDVLKLASRHGPANPLIGDTSQTGRSSGFLEMLSFIGPVLATALIPFPGSPIAYSAGDLLTILALLAVRPLSIAAMRLRAGGLPALEGARMVGRLVVGLVTTFVAAAALAEAAPSKQLNLTSLSAAPETALQALVRLLAGVALLVALPWWLDRRGVTHENAGAYAGHFLQASALAALWVSLVLPAPGELLWALPVMIVGALFAYVAMSIISERLAVGMREKDAANRVWAAALPAAAVALVAAIWFGA